HLRVQCCTLDAIAVHMGQEVSVNRFTRIHFTTRCIALLACITGLAGSAFADRTIQPSRTFSTGPGVLSSTLTVRPQIQLPSGITHRIEENDGAAPPITDPVNNLTAGGLMAGSRGNPRVAFPGPGFTGYVPPDCDMGVGPTHV